MVNTFDELVPGNRYEGITPGEQVKLIDVQERGDSTASVAYRTSGGALTERILRTTDLASVQECSSKRWAFDGSGEDFRLASEARRMLNAHLVDPFHALDTSNIDPYPHQIEAVYECLLEQRPIKFLLADDPGAGKTIMSGMLIRELMLRGDVEKCLIIAPGNLVEQWRVEMSDKFGLDFGVIYRPRIEDSRGNPFSEKNLLLARMDQLARNEILIANLKASKWDLIIVDEAHKMSAQQVGDKLKRTKRYQLGEELGDLTRHRLFLSATPHNGKNEDFYAFMKLIDSERFAGRLMTKDLPNIDDIMRRYVKEDMKTFSGQNIFPERKATTINFELSEHERQLYEGVTRYVKEGMKRAEKMRESGKEWQGLIASFALTVLQRRLASSPDAIYISLERRLNKFLDYDQTFAEKTKNNSISPKERKYFESLSEDSYIDAEDMPEEELLELEDRAVEVVATLQTPKEIADEESQLRSLLELAGIVRDSGKDAKWTELRGWLRDNYENSKEKMIIFSEYRDTTEYVARKIKRYIKNSDAVAIIHGKLTPENRRKTQSKFMDDPKLRILVATDVAGEGVNLQIANLMINYDIPWNPNRIEQRFGRIHRIGQQRTCYLFNLVAHQTKEGQVLQRLFEKIEEQRKVYGDKVYDVLGDTFFDKSLRNLLLEAIFEDVNPVDDISSATKKIDSEFGYKFVSLLEKQALSNNSFDIALSEKISKQMEEAKVRRLQPWFVQSFFGEALRRYNGSMIKRKNGRYEIIRVPTSIREQNNLGIGYIDESYSRVTFDKNCINVPGEESALMIKPATLLMDAVVDKVISETSNAIQRGAILIDEEDFSDNIRLLIYLEHVITDGREQYNENSSPVSKRFLYVEINNLGICRDAGPEPYLGYSTIEDSESLVKDRILEEFRFELQDNEIEKIAEDWAIEHLVSSHYIETEKRVKAKVEKERSAVIDRLGREISFYEKRALELEKREEAGRRRKLNSAQMWQRVEELENRLERRLSDLEREESLQNKLPVIVSAAMIVPQGLIDKISGTNTQPANIVRQREINEQAVEAVLRTEQKLGRDPKVSADNNPGYDIVSIDAETGKHYYINIRGYSPQAKEISVNTRQVLHAKNNPDSWIFAIVEVPDNSGKEPQVRYIQEPYRRVTTRFTQSKISLEVEELLAEATEPS